MDTTMRPFHVIFGIFVGGTYLFMVPILASRLRQLGPTDPGAVMQALMPILTQVMATSLTGLIVTGLIMTAQERGLGSLFNSGWGVDILIGPVATVGVIIVGFRMLSRPTSGWVRSARRPRTRGSRQRPRRVSNRGNSPPASRS